MLNPAQTAFLFPGQGAQAPGMGESLFPHSPTTRALVEKASEALDLDLARTIAEGPSEILDSTRVSQPAIFLTSLAVLDVLGQKSGSDRPFGLGLEATATAGLSLGEYSALVFAGCLDPEEALSVVIRRGACMQEACDATPGAMTSLVGLPAEQIEALVKEASSAGVVTVANYNSPEQTVISGEKAAVDEASRLATEAGCKRAIELRVAGAYHSPLMSSATEKLRPVLESVTIQPPRCAFFANVSGERVEDVETIRRGLIEQVESSVRWVAIHRALVTSGVSVGIEAGPGKVITGLARKIDRDLRVSPLGDLEGIEKLVASEENES